VPYRQATPPLQPLDDPEASDLLAEDVIVTSDVASLDADNGPELETVRPKIAIFVVQLLILAGGILVGMSR